MDTAALEPASHVCVNADASVVASANATVAMTMPSSIQRSSSQPAQAGHAPQRHRNAHTPVYGYQDSVLTIDDSIPMHRHSVTNQDIKMETSQPMATNKATAITLKTATATGIALPNPTAETSGTLPGLVGKEAVAVAAVEDQSRSNLSDPLSNKMMMMRGAPDESAASTVPIPSHQHQQQTNPALAQQLQGTTHQSLQSNVETSQHADIGESQATTVDLNSGSYSSGGGEGHSQCSLISEDSAGASGLPASQSAIVPAPTPTVSTSEFPAGSTMSASSMKLEDISALLANATQRSLMPLLQQSFTSGSPCSLTSAAPTTVDSTTASSAAAQMHQHSHPFVSSRPHQWLTNLQQQASSLSALTASVAATRSNPTASAINPLVDMKSYNTTPVPQMHQYTPASISSLTSPRHQGTTPTINAASAPTFSLSADARLAGILDPMGDTSQTSLASASSRGSQLSALASLMTSTKDLCQTGGAGLGRACTALDSTPLTSMFSGVTLSGANTWNTSTIGASNANTLGRMNLDPLVAWREMVLSSSSYVQAQLQRLRAQEAAANAAVTVPNANLCTTTIVARNASNDLCVTPAVSSKADGLRPKPICQE